MRAPAVDKLPAFQVLVLLIISYNEAVQGNIIWPFLPFAVQKWGAAPDDVGTYVGVLASSFFFAQLLFGALWGKASDKYGRRPILLMGLVGTGLTQIVFGLAKTYEVALLARFLTGALNGNVAIAKVYMGEITGKTTQAKGFAWLSFTWGFGTITAPALGGYLADPATLYPNSAIGKLPFFIEYPYLLPALISTVVSFSSFFLGLCFLPETEAWRRNNALTQETKKKLFREQKEQLQLQGKKKSKKTKRRENNLPPPPTTVVATSAVDSGSATATASSMDGVITSTESSTSSNKNSTDHTQIEMTTSKKTTHVTKNSIPTATATTTTTISPSSTAPPSSSLSSAQKRQQIQIIEEDDDEEEDEEDGSSYEDDDDDSSYETDDDDDTDEEEEDEETEEEELEESETAGLVPGGGKKKKKSSMAVVKPTSSSASSPPLRTNVKKKASSSRSTTSSSIVIIEKPPPPLPQDAGFRDIMKDKAIMIAIANYGVLAFCQILFDELLPVLCKTDRSQGGLGWQSADVGSLQLVQGAVQVTFNLLLYPHLTKMFGLLLCFRHAMWPLIPLTIIFPAIARLSPWPQFLWLGMAVGVGMKAALMATSFTSIMLLINNSSRGSALGAINGFAQSVASFVRAVGPTLGGALFSASVRADSLGAARLHTVYAVMAILAAITFALSFYLPAWCNEAPDVVVATSAANAARGGSSSSRSTITTSGGRGETNVSGSLPPVSDDEEESEEEEEDDDDLGTDDDDEYETDDEDEDEDEWDTDDEELANAAKGITTINNNNSNSNNNNNNNKASQKQTQETPTKLTITLPLGKKTASATTPTTNMMAATISNARPRHSQQQQQQRQQKGISTPSSTSKTAPKVRR